MTTTALRQPKAKKEQREMIFVGIDENDIQRRFNLRVPKICNCKNSQYVLKAQISNDYSARGVLAKSFEIKCLRCGKVETFKPEGEESLINEQKTLF